jgi:DNA-binding NarL/FixJ family response regulator
MGIRVIIADDHEAVREGLRSVLAGESDIEIVGEAEDGTVAVQMTEDLQPDIVIMDLSMPNMGGIEATSLIKQRCPRTSVIALSAYNMQDLVLRMLKAGASGYVRKDDAFAELLNALRIVSGGDFYLSPRLAPCVGTVCDVKGSIPDTPDGRG